MPGVKQFDRAEVLAKAMEVFWRKGYEATSIQDLLDAMGIGRGSLYSTFGDKEQLFLAVWEFYSNKIQAELIECLSDPNPNKAIEEMFAAIVKRMSDPIYPRGCLHTNTIIESPRNSCPIESKIAESLEKMETGIYQVLLRGQAANLIAPGRDLRAIARFLLAVAQGIAVMNKAYSNPSVIRDVVDVALNNGIWDSSTSLKQS
ncbi:MAG: TetR/AcrR family transcriptional regulator [Cyanobacteria bacterium P01_G01_bin.19]